MNLIKAVKNNSTLEQFNLDRLEPYSEIKLVDYREFFRKHIDGNEKYQIHDKSLHHICFVEDIKTAKLIVDSINFYYSSM